MLAWIWRSSLEGFPAYSGAQFALFFMLLNLSCAALLPWFANLRQISEPACSVFTWISILSYSLYLCHESAILISQMAFFHLGIVPGKGWLLVAWLMGSFLMAWMSYRFVEKPFLRLRDATTPAKPDKVPASTVRG
jgi:peptidoglycan/LPS O-acetylase OafA/YrhL